MIGSHTENVDDIAESIRGDCLAKCLLVVPMRADGVVYDGDGHVAARAQPPDRQDLGVAVLGAHGDGRAALTVTGAECSR